MLGGVDDIEIVGEGASGAKALELVARLAPDLVIMDVMMPEMDGITAARELRWRFPDVPSWRSPASARAPWSSRHCRRGRLATS